MCFGANLVNEKVVLQPRQMPWHLSTRGRQQAAISGIRIRIRIQIPAQFGPINQSMRRPRFPKTSTNTHSYIYIYLSVCVCAFDIIL